jgi:hypothetical protein
LSTNQLASPTMYAVYIIKGSLGKSLFLLRV